MSFQETFDRIKESTEIENQAQLADFLCIKPPQISKQRKKNNFPVEWAYIVAKKNNLLTEWILTGDGPKSLDAPDKENNFDFPILKELNTWLIELVADEPHRHDWFRGSLEDAFPMFKEWLKRKEKENSENPISTDTKVA